MITHLVATASEARKPAGKRSNKLAAAIESGVPIVTPAYLFALSGTPPDPDELPNPPTAPPAGASTDAGKAPAGGGGAAAKSARRGGKRPAAEVICLDSSDDEAAAAAAAAPAAKEEVVVVDDDGGEEEETPPELMKVGELRAALGARGLPSGGKKAELLVRLQQAMQVACMHMACMYCRDGRAPL